MMATMQVSNNDDVILVEFEPASGVRTFGLSPTDIAEKSQEAVDQALKTVQAMAKKSLAAIQAIPLAQRPDTIAVEFGLKLDVEGTAVVAKASVEAAINVTLTWQKATATTTAKAKRR
ncbi:MAG TPA: CU044_2847 family protein [Anaerolineales bacterium]|nr:CU044_2847 family protein [Anaerolineales bacterium]